MKRIRNVGLAALAVMSLAATIGVGSASAASIISESSVSTTITGTGTGTNSFGLGRGTIACSPVSALGVQNSKASQALQASTAAVAQGPLSCSEYPYFSSATLQPNGCTFTYRPGAEVSKGKFSGTLDLGPATCSIIIQVPEGGGWPACQVTIAAKSGLTATYENIGTGTGRTVRVSLNAANLKYTRSGSVCGTQSGENGTWSGSWELKGSNPNTGVQIGIYLEQTSGLQLTGEESAEKAKQPRFKNGVYSASILGGVSTTSKFTEDALGETVECGSGSLGPATVLADTADLSINASYEPCTAATLGYKSTMKMNSCNYVFHVANVGPPYSGSTDIACSKEGDAIEAVVTGTSGTTVCSLLFPAQKLGTASYEMTGSGETRKVIANVKGEGLKASRTGSVLCGPKSSTTGSFTGGFFLTGP